MKKILTAAAGLALAAAPLAGLAAPASASVAAVCAVHVLNVTKQGPGGWYKAKITKACPRGSVRAEIECRDIRNHNFLGYGKTVYRKGAVSYKKCGTTLQIKEDWVIIGGKKHEVWPRQT